MYSIIFFVLIKYVRYSEDDKIILIRPFIFPRPYFIVINNPFVVLITICESIRMYLSDTI